MQKRSLKKIYIWASIILAALIVMQCIYFIALNFEKQSNHSKVEAILDSRLKYNWDQKDQQLAEINALVENGHLYTEDLGRLYERAAIIYMSDGDTMTYYKYLGYALYNLQESTNTDFTINVYLDLANFYLSNYDYNSASDIIDKAQSICPFENITNPQIQSYAYRMLGINYFLRYKYNDAETYLNKAIRTLEQSEEDTSSYVDEYTAMCDVWLARVYEETGRLEKCNEKLEKWEDNYMFTTEIYRNIYLRDFIIPYYQAKCYYLCAENIKTHADDTQEDIDARAQAVIDYLHEFMALCEENNYEKAELYTILKVQKEYPTRNEEIQTELVFVLNRLQETLFNQQNLTYSSVVSSIVNEAMIEVTGKKNDAKAYTQKLTIFIGSALILSTILLTFGVLLYNSRFDELTQLLNRKAFDRDLLRVKHTRATYGIIMLDIDDFKRVNDTYGHPEGDIVLWRLGQLINNEVTSDIKAYRYGGEEFVLLVNHVAMPYIEKIGERIRQYMQQQAWTFDTSLVLTVSIGIASGNGFEDVVKKADDNLYISKKTGKNKITNSANESETKE